MTIYIALLKTTGIVEVLVPFKLLLWIFLIVTQIYKTFILFAKIIKQDLMKTEAQHKKVVDESILPDTKSSMHHLFFI